VIQWSHNEDKFKQESEQQMSTNSECHFFQWGEGGKWYYLLEDYNAPKNAWDWREYATCYGPFDTEEKADYALRNGHANPGGSTAYVAETTDKVLAEHVKKATKPRPRGFRFYY
jgi:hypothetical protein